MWVRKDRRRIGGMVSFQFISPSLNPLLTIILAILKIVLLEVLQHRWRLCG